MPTTVPLNFRVYPIPRNFKGDINALAQAIAARLTAESGSQISFFASGSTAPTSDVGPWWDGTKWWAWDTGTAAYVAQDIAPSSLGYIAQVAAPDQTVYTFWIELDGGGKAQAIKYYSGGAWKDVYEDKFATYSTTTAMNAAIAAAVAGVSFNAYVGVATLNVAQAVPVDATPHKMTLDTAQINGSGAIVLASSRYVAPASGVYQVVCNPQFDNDTGVAASMEVITSLYKNGSPATEGIGGFDGTPSPSGSRWNAGFTGLIQLAANDYIEVWATLQDGTNTGSVDLTTWDFSVHRVSS